VTKDPKDEHATDLEQPAYESPQVEQVMGADEIAREVHYAGDVGPVISGNIP
jgi:hypothetical protein